jgi:ABC-2 type transport system permease protein
MTLWRLEILRLIRTHRWTIVVGVYVAFAVIGALTARYMGEIMTNFATDMVVEVPEPRPVDGVGQFLGNVTQIGLLAIVIVAAGSLAIDARTEVAAFLRVRVERARTLLWPRYTAVTMLAVFSLVLGTAITWVLTSMLIGRLPAAAMLLGTLYGAIYLLFAVAVVAAVAGTVRTTTPTVFLSLLALLLLPVLGLFPPVQPWLPSHLVGAVASMVEGTPASEYLRATIVTLVAVPALLTVAASGLERREL